MTETMSHEPIPAAGVARPSEGRERCVLIYTRFNRLWHWSQVASIFILMVTGFRILGLHPIMPFGLAVTLHTVTALALLLLWIFATFWLFTTGVWRQFLPTAKGLWDVARFYSWGVFRGEDHPYQRIFRRRHNPLQALAYFLLKMLIFPAIWSTGLIYLLRALWMRWDPAGFWLTIVANLHILAAFAVFSFVIIHVYLLTIGHGFREHVRPMLTGFDRIKLSPEQEAYLESDEPDRLR